MGYNLGDHAQNIGDAFSWMMNSTKTRPSRAEAAPKNPVRPSQPDGEETLYAPRIELKPGPWDPGYKKPANIVMDVVPEAATNPDRRATDVAFVPDSTLNNGRDNSRTNPNGIVQKGTDMGRSFNDLLATTNTSGYQPFSSNQLPTTQGNPFSGIAPKTDTFNPAAPGITGATYDNYGADGGAAAALPGTLADKDQFNPSAARIEGGSSRRPGGSLSEALADTAGINSYMDKFSSGDRQRAASSAFLNAEDSLSGLQARDAVNDVVYAGGQHYGRGALTEDGKLGDKYKIDRADARDIASGKQTASGLLDVYKSRIQESAGETTPVEAQEPLTIEKPGVKQSFGRTTPITPGIDTSIPDTTAFNSNNGVEVPEFGNTGGYKPTSKKPEVDYSSIFSY